MTGAHIPQTGRYGRSQSWNDRTVPKGGRSGIRPRVLPRASSLVKHQSRRTSAQAGATREQRRKSLGRLARPGWRARSFNRPVALGELVAGTERSVVAASSLRAQAIGWRRALSRLIGRGRSEQADGCRACVQERAQVRRRATGADARLAAAVREAGACAIGEVCPDTVSKRRSILDRHVEDAPEVLDLDIIGGGYWTPSSRSPPDIEQPAS